MIQPMNHTVSGQNLLDSYQIHYNFESFASGEDLREHVVSDADSTYSGRILAEKGSVADPTASMDYFTGNVGTGNFSGGLGEYYNHIQITNHSDLFDEEFCFLIGAQTTSRRDIGEPEKGPVSNNNILFSNWSGSGNCYNGWQMGINAANRAYIETYNNLQPTVVTYMGTTPYTHNIWAFLYRAGELSVGRFDIKEEEFDFYSTSVDLENLQSGSFWNIGSGINFDPSVKFTDSMVLNSGLFAGKIDQFIYFNTGLSSNQANQVAKSIYGGHYLDSSATSENTLESFGGFTTSTSNQTGEIGVSGTNTPTSTTGSITFYENIPLSGSTSYGSIYYELLDTIPHEISGTQGIYRTLYNTGYPLTGVTGFTTVEHTSGLSSSANSFSSSVVTGYLFSGSGYSLVLDSAGSETLTNAISGVSGEAGVNLRPDALSYISEDPNFVVEKYNADGFEINNKWSLNNQASQGYATRQDGLGLYIDRSRGEDTIGLYLNGEGREHGQFVSNGSVTSEIIKFTTSGQTYVITCTGVFEINSSGVTDDEISTYFDQYSIESGDYFLSGREVVDSLQFAGYYEKPLVGIYDINLPETGRDRWVVPDVSYYSGVDSDVESNGNMVFFNGQKLISGMNYEYTGKFSPSGFITGTTGVYFSFPEIPTSSSVTGSEASFYGDYFWPNSNIVFFNGLRQDVKSSYIEHSSTKDLISGRKTVANNLINIYNN